MIEPFDPPEQEFTIKHLPSLDAALVWKNENIPHSLQVYNSGGSVIFACARSLYATWHIGDAWFEDLHAKTCYFRVRSAVHFEIVCELCSELMNALQVHFAKADPINYTILDYLVGRAMWFC
jgi:hypothetical protein